MKAGDRVRVTRTGTVQSRGATLEDGIEIDDQVYFYVKYDGDNDEDTAFVPETALEILL